MQAEALVPLVLVPGEGEQSTSHFGLFTPEEKTSSTVGPISVCTSFTLPCRPAQDPVIKLSYTESHLWTLGHAVVQFV